MPDAVKTEHPRIIQLEGPGLAEPAQQRYLPQARELYRLFHQQPFQPVRVFLKDGRVFEIKHEELVVVGINFLDIGIPRPDDPRPFYDYIETVPFEALERVEREPACCWTPS